jgi:hypothetical protein
VQPVLLIGSARFPSARWPREVSAAGNDQTAAAAPPSRRRAAAPRQRAPAVLASGVVVAAGRVAAAGALGRARHPHQDHREAGPAADEQAAGSQVRDLEAPQWAGHGRRLAGTGSGEAGAEQDGGLAAARRAGLMGCRGPGSRVRTWVPAGSPVMP